MHSRFSISLLIIFFVAPVLLGGQSGAFLYEHFTERDGLMHAEIVQISQDRFGLIWLGTLSGMSCYDGAGFRHYLHDMNDPRSLPRTRAYNLLIDGNGGICLGLEADIARFRYDSCDFELLPLDTANWNYIITHTDLRKPGSLFGSHKKTGQLFALDTRYFKPENGFIDPQGKAFVCPPVINSYYSGRDRTLWLSNGACIHRLFLNGRVVQNATSVPLPEICRKEGVRFASLYADTIRDKLWCFVQTFSKDRIYVKDLGDGPLEHFTKFDVFLREINPSLNAGFDVSVDPVGKIWIKSGLGIMIIFPDDRADVLKHNPLNTESLPSESLLTLYHDPFGTTWVGHSFGLSKVRLLSTNFRVSQPAAVQKLTKKVQKPHTIYGICEGTDGTIWAGLTYYGLAGLSPEETGNKDMAVPFGKYSRPDNRGVAGLMCDKTGDIWIGTFHNGIFKYKPGQDRLTKVNRPAGDNRDIAYVVRGFLEMPDGKIWFSRVNGISCIDPANNNWRHYDFLFKDQNVVVGGHHVFGLCADASGTIWAGYGHSALYYLPPEASDFIRIDFPFDFHVLAIFYDSTRHVLWIGTQGTGLGRFNLTTRQFDRFYNEKDGFSGNMVYGLVRDHHDDLWLSTNYGIFRFKPESGLFTRFGKGDGLPADDLYSIGFHYSARTGRVYFGSLDGLISFHPDSVSNSLGQSNTTSAPLLFTTVKVAGQDYWTYCYGRHQDKELVLQPGENSLELVFSALDNIFPNKKYFRWKLEGLDREWNSPQALGKAVYAQLLPGHYRFVAQIFDDNGRLLEPQLSLSIYARPYWWQRADMQAFGAVLLLSFFVGMAIWQTRRLQQKRVTAASQRAVEAQIAALRSQLDPHFVFNSLIAIGGFVAQNEKTAAKDYLARFAGLFRRMLNFSGKPHISLEADLEFLREYIALQQERYPGKFEYRELLSPPDLDTRAIQVPPLLFQPLIENAIEHGLSGRETPGGILSLAISLLPGHLEISIEDNGRGLGEEQQKEADKHQSKGILLLRERLHLQTLASGRLHSLNIGNRSPEPGTRVQITLPN